MILLKSKALSILEIVLEGENKVTKMSEILDMDPWEIERHLGHLRNQKFISSQESSIHVLDNKKVRLLAQLAKKMDVKKLLHGLNDKVLPLLVIPITREELLEKAAPVSRATVFRALKDFTDLEIIDKTPYGIQLINENQILIDFANSLNSQRSLWRN